MSARARFLNDDYVRCRSRYAARRAKRDASKSRDTPGSSLSGAAASLPVILGRTNGMLAFAECLLAGAVCRHLAEESN